ncbi:hypothetical protein GDO86_005816 [Hymenochirus boettgeri]|uniref:CBM21 domain-containing protein n=1 Tax=Hymenochirus boettgeri TaxID=247094 RepID=A0A8T2J917_9PIPI|nr:hypothetical protein GDO86_005816 [Hymenochirus boettgeri]
MDTFEENSKRKDKLIEYPPLGDTFLEEEDVKGSIKPHFSPLPKRRNSASSDEGELEPPTTVARKVSFADAFGFDLVSVKEFDTWEVPIVSQILNFEKETNQPEEFFLKPTFSLLSADSIMEKLQTKKILLESMDSTPGITSMKGIIRVLNLSYEKQIYVRMSLDDWQNYYDLLAEYIPDSCNGDTDQFVFTISLATPYQKEGVTVQFCLCYETQVGTFWDNNEGQNYTLVCHKKEYDVQRDQLTEDLTEKYKKSCLKSSPSKEDDDLEDEHSRATVSYIPRIICSHDDYTEDITNEEYNTSEEKNNDVEEDLELFLNQKLMKARILYAEDKNSAQSSEEEFLNTKQKDVSMELHEESNSDILKQFNEGKKICSENFNSKEFKEFSPNEICPTEHMLAQEAGEIKYISSSNNSLEASINSPEAENPEKEIHQLIDTNLFSNKQYKELVSNSQGDMGKLQEENASTLSVISNESRKTILGPCDDPIKINIFEQSDSNKYTGNLDDNANPKVSQNTGDASYLSIQIAERTKGKTKQLAENDNSNVTHVDEDFSTKAPKDNVVLLNQFPHKIDNKSTYSFRSPDTEHESPSHSFDCGYKQIKDIDAVVSPSNSNESKCHLDLSSDNAHSKTKSVNEEKTNKSKTTPDFHDTTKAENNQEVLTENESLYTQTVPTQTSKPFSIFTDNSPTFNPSDFQNDKSYFICAEHSEGFHKDEWPMAEESSQDQEENKVETTAENAPDCTACNTYRTREDCALNTTDKIERNEHQHVAREKVIITLITEEKGEKETVQGRDSRNVYYIDVFQEGKENPEELAETISKSGFEIISCNPENKSIHSTHEDEEIDREDILSNQLDDMIHSSDVSNICDVKQVKMTTASKINEADTVLVSPYAVPKDQLKNYFADFANELATVDESDSQSTDLDCTDTQSSNSFCDTSDGSTGYDIMTQANTAIRPTILISEPDDEEMRSGSFENEEHSTPDDNEQPYFYSYIDQELHPREVTKGKAIACDSLNIGNASSKVLCFVMFVVFAGLMYHYDFLVCFALYLFSLYWLYWEGDRNKKSIRKD